MLSLIALFLLVRGLAFFEDASSYPLTARILESESQLEKPALEAIRHSIPTRFRGADVAQWMLFSVLMLAWLALNAAHAALRAHASWRRRGNGVASPEAGLAGIGRSHNLDREQLLEIYAQTKKSLEQQRAWLAFLSLDVVNSTEMKVGEDPEIAERDFIQYRHYVEKVIATHHALKSAWTPDGVMICFANLRQAIAAAQAVIQGLEEFNRRVKTIRSDFSVRAGINVGEVLYDEAVHMEQMSDLVIDVAGHMQKHCGVNTICLSKEALENPLGKFNFNSTTRLVDGHQVYEWNSGMQASKPSTP